MRCTLILEADAKNVLPVCHAFDIATMSGMSIADWHWGVSSDGYRRIIGCGSDAKFIELCVECGMCADDELALAAFDKIAAERMDASGVAVSEGFGNDVTAWQPKTNCCHDSEQNDKRIFLHTRDVRKPNSLLYDTNSPPVV